MTFPDSVGATDKDSSPTDEHIVEQNQQPESSTSVSQCACICSSQCCQDFLKVFQVKDSTIINKTKKMQGQRSRQFCCDWYTTYPWLVLCVTRLKAFCVYCRYCDNRGLLKDKLSDRAFISSGFGKKRCNGLNSIHNQMFIKNHYSE